MACFLLASHLTSHWRTQPGCLRLTCEEEGEDGAGSVPCGLPTTFCFAEGALVPAGRAALPAAGA